MQDLIIVIIVLPIIAEPPLTRRPTGAEGAFWCISRRAFLEALQNHSSSSIS
jgi:hypothetical protein